MQNTVNLTFAPKKTKKRTIPANDACRFFNNHLFFWIKNRSEIKISGFMKSLIQNRRFNYAKPMEESKAMKRLYEILEGIPPQNITY